MKFAQTKALCEGSYRGATEGLKKVKRSRSVQAFVQIALKYYIYFYKLTT